MSSVFSPSEAAEQSGFSLDTPRGTTSGSACWMTSTAHRVVTAQHNHLREKIDWYRSQLPAIPPARPN